MGAGGYQRVPESPARRSLRLRPRGAERGGALPRPLAVLRAPRGVEGEGGGRLERGLLCGRLDSRVERRDAAGSSS